MGKYSIYATKQDYEKMYAELKELEAALRLTLDWKTIKMSNLDKLSVSRDMLKMQLRHHKTDIAEPELFVAICEWVEDGETKWDVVNAGKNGEGVSLEEADESCLKMKWDGPNMKQRAFKVTAQKYKIMLGGKPNVKLVGEDSNVYNLMAICIQGLKEVGQGDKVQEFKQRVLNAGSYDEALQIMLEYVDAE